MRKKKKDFFFSPLSSLLHLVMRLYLLLLLLASPALGGASGVCAGCTISPWNRFAYEVVNGTTFGFLQNSCSFQTTTHGDPRYYTCPGFQPLPPAISSLWGTDGLDAFPGLGFSEPSRLPQAVCSLGPNVDTNWFVASFFVFLVSRFLTLARAL